MNPAAAAAAAVQAVPADDITAAEAVPQLLPSRPDEGLRPLGSKPLRILEAGGGAAAPRFDPALLPDVLRVFHRASRRLHFSTQLPQALATYIATASQRGTLDLAAFDVSVCKELLLFLGHAQVVNRDCLEELCRALQRRWSELQPDELVEVLVALGRLNDADRVATHTGRPGPGASRLLRLLLDAEPCVTPLLEAQAAAAAAAPAPIAAAAGRRPPAVVVVPQAPPSGCGGGGIAAATIAAGLPPGGAAQLALAYLSFYRSATSGHQHFVTSIMLQHGLELSLAALGDPADPRAAPAEELGRLAAGLAGVALVRSHGLAPCLPRLVAAVIRRAAELPQPARALLLDLPPQHWALPPNWRSTLLSTAPGGSGRKAGTAAAAAAARKA